MLLRPPSPGLLLEQDACSARVVTASRAECLRAERAAGRSKSDKGGMVAVGGQKRCPASRVRRLHTLTAIHILLHHGGVCGGRPEHPLHTHTFGIHQHTTTEEASGRGTREETRWHSARAVRAHWALRARHCDPVCEAAPEAEAQPRWRWPSQVASITCPWRVYINELNARNNECSGNGDLSRTPHAPTGYDSLIGPREAQSLTPVRCTAIQRIS